jgi:alginate O-acetyltransferase complex protein AlgI
LFVFLPAVLGGYYAIKAVSVRSNAIANLWLLFGSIVFYIWGAPHSDFLVVLSLTIAFDYFAAILIWSIRDGGPQSRPARILLASSICLNLITLGYYKYANLITHDVIWRFALITSWTDIALPIGISFIAFHKISYVIDIYNGKVPPKRNLRDYLLYILFFPQLIAGPIVRFHTIAHQIDKRSHSVDDTFEGIWRFSLGLAKKIIIANQLGIVADQVFSRPAETLSGSIAWIGVLMYAFQIYFDFSGYSDMAIGLGRLFGFRLPENFNRPYISKSVTEFWQRWHITLSLFFRDYLYIPLGGNRVSFPRTLLNLWIVFLLCGLWHGAKMNFVVWGAYYGFWLTLERLFLSRLLARIPSLISNLYAFFVVLCGWVFFRATDLTYASHYFLKMFGPSTGSTASYDLVIDYHIYPKVLICIAVAAAISFAPEELIRLAKPQERTLIWLKGSISIGLCLASLIALSTDTFSPFLYFQF